MEHLKRQEPGLQTPVYVVDEAALVHNLEILQGVQQRTGCHILLAQKAFSMFRVYPLIGQYLAGATASGFVLAIMMSNSGGAWDNAKKYIESGHHGGKGSPEHKAAVVGDTVGDPFKDTSGPSINILIKLLSIVSIVFAAVVANFSLIK